jgi:hypothetical protein
LPVSGLAVEKWLPHPLAALLFPPPTEQPLPSDFVIAIATSPPYSYSIGLLPLPGSEMLNLPHHGLAELQISNSMRDSL